MDIIRHIEYTGYAHKIFDIQNWFSHTNNHIGLLIVHLIINIFPFYS